MNEPKPLPSETKLVETPKKKYRQCLLCQCIGPECLIDGLKRDRDKAESALASLADELRLAREALKRLGSMEAFKGPRAVNEHDAELIARIDFARAAMKEPR